LTHRVNPTPEGKEKARHNKEKCRCGTPVRQWSAPRKLVQVV
jgi:hypothetical protein